jgi:endonuclease/exonuclease/phosphatase family metal-dependent hydrolase
MTKIRVVSYNIHKGLSLGGIRHTLPEIREKLRQIDADIVFLQEAMGEQRLKRFSCPQWNGINQVAYLAQDNWPYMHYMPNSLHNRGHHGNAIISKFPLTIGDNTNLSTNPFEKRGLLHAFVDIGKSFPLHLYCTHLNLLERDRQKQMQIIINTLRNTRNTDDSLLLCGDFNDWRHNLTEKVSESLQLLEVHSHLTGSIPATFPSSFPKLSLDRIFFKNLNPREIYHPESHWKKLSDHLPLLAEFSL